MATLIDEGIKPYNASSLFIGLTPSAGQTLIVMASHRGASQGASPAADIGGVALTLIGQHEAQIENSDYRRTVAVWARTFDGNESLTNSIVTVTGWSSISHQFYWHAVDLGGLTLKDVYFSDSGEHTTNPTDGTAEVTTAALAANSYRVGYAAWKKDSDNPSDDATISWDNLTDSAESGININIFAMHQHGGHLEDATPGAKTDTATLSAGNTTSLGWVAAVVAWEPEGAGGTELEVGDATHGHAADSPALTQSHTLTVADSAHGHSAEAVTLADPALRLDAEGGDNLLKDTDSGASLTSEGIEYIVLGGEAGARQIVDQGTADITDGALDDLVGPWGVDDTFEVALIVDGSVRGIFPATVVDRNL